jgi:hypothetical protein
MVRYSSKNYLGLIPDDAKVTFKFEDKPTIKETWKELGERLKSEPGFRDSLRDANYTNVEWESNWEPDPEQPGD